MAPDQATEDEARSARSDVFPVEAAGGPAPRDQEAWGPVAQTFALWHFRAESR
jgi:hypothetical protein